MPFPDRGSNLGRRPDNTNTQVFGREPIVPITYEVALATAQGMSPGETQKFHLTQSPTQTQEANLRALGTVSINVNIVTFTRARK